MDERASCSGVKTGPELRMPYSYEEFAEHMKAMPTVRKWEYTSRFGFLGSAQTSQANNARVLEYFSDCYPEAREAVYKAELFLTIYDYIARNATVFARKGLLDQLGKGMFAAEPALLRAVHYAFSVSGPENAIAPRKILALTRAFEQL